MSEEKVKAIEIEEMEQVSGGSAGADGYGLMLEVYRGDTMILRDLRGPSKYDTAERQRRRVAREFKVPVEKVRLYDSHRREVVYENSLSQNRFSRGDTIVAVISD